MSCEETVEELNRYLDRELSDEEVARVRAHLDDCPDCLKCFEFQAELKRLVRKECASEDVPERLRHWVRALGASRPKR